MIRLLIRCYCCAVFAILSLAPAISRGFPVVTASPSVSVQEPPAQEDRKPRFKRFYVAPDRGVTVQDARDYAEAVIRRTGVARLASSPETADYVIYIAARSEGQVSRQDHVKDVEKEYINDKGEKKKKTEQQTTHRDDVLTVTTAVAYRILRVEKDGTLREITRSTGQATRSTAGPKTSGHSPDDPPLHIRRDEIPLLTEQMTHIEGNSAEGALYKAIYDLCSVQGPVTDVDYKANRLTVRLGTDDGIHSREHPAGVTEMEIYARTGNTRAYLYQDPDSGALFVPDKRSVEARPENPETWTYAQADALRGERKRVLDGPEARALVPLGEKISDWAEVQEVRADSCTVALKHKADFGRTTDDMKALERVPDPHSVPVIARVRVKRGFLH